MKPDDRAAGARSGLFRLMVSASLLAVPLAVLVAGGQHDKDRAVKKVSDKKAAEPSVPEEKATSKTTPAKATRSVEVQFIDGSSMKLTLRDERIELSTPYGKLLIPVGDIERIELATRIPDAVAKRIDAAIADLGHVEFPRREAASAVLLELRERAYPALVKAERSDDKEVTHRVHELLERIRAEVPEEQLESRPHDVVYTADSKFTGRLTPAALKVNTFQFGEQQLKLADVRGLRLPFAGEAEPANVLADPGNLGMMQGQIGTIHAFRVTGQGQGNQPMAGGPGGLMVLGGGGNIWGTDTYTLDSTLALAAVHAGVLKPGQTGVVRVKILGPQAVFQASTRHGVTSMAFGPFNGAFQFVRGRGREGR